jgi:hypothetical protein
MGWTCDEDGRSDLAKITFLLKQEEVEIEGEADES